MCVQHLSDPPLIYYKKHYDIYRIIKKYIYNKMCCLSFNFVVFKSDVIFNHKCI